MAHIYRMDSNNYNHQPSVMMNILCLVSREKRDASKARHSWDIFVLLTTNTLPQMAVCLHAVPQRRR